MSVNTNWLVMANLNLAQRKILKSWQGLCKECVISWILLAKARIKEQDVINLPDQKRQNKSNI